VGAAQFTAAPCLSTNTSRIIASIREAGDAGIDLLAFAETATTGYFPETIAAVRPEALHEAEGQIAEACGAAGVAAVVGTPFFSAGRCFNSATVIDRHGSIVGRQHKLQLVPTDDWAVAGEDQAVFWLPGIPLPLSVIVCHDKRYPELVRLPVLAGARLIVYISHETWHDGETSPQPFFLRCLRWCRLTTHCGLTSKVPCGRRPGASHGGGAGPLPRPGPGPRRREPRLHPPRQRMRQPHRHGGRLPRPLACAVANGGGHGGGWN